MRAVASFNKAGPVIIACVALDALGGRMRFPKATLALFALLSVAYFSLSGGLLFIPDSQLNSLAMAPSSSPLGFLSHLFVHVGAIHLAGNLFPLLVFGLMLEASVASLDVLLVFFSSGLLAGALFSLLNPGTALAGASAGVSGLIGAAVSVRPGLSLALLVAVPLSFSLLLPLISQAVFQQQSVFFEKENELKREFEELVQQNRAQEASAVARELSLVSEKKRVVEQGAKREASTQTDFFVHLAGVAVGVAFVVFFRRGAFEKGALEVRTAFSSLGLSRRKRKPK